MDEAPLDRRIAALADRQHGVVTSRQLTAFGLSRQAVAKRVRAGRLHRIHRGVFAVGRRHLDRDGRFHAAALACGPRAVLSHRSAAAILGILKRPGAEVEVTVPGAAGRRRRSSITVYRRALPLADTGHVDGVPVTSPARTLVDLAEVLARRGVERAIDEAAFLKLDLSELRPRDGRRGAPTLAMVLEEHEPGSTRTRSDLEEAMLALCRQGGLPRPRVNAVVEGHEVDFSWRDAGLIVETDGRAGHTTPGAFERDRLRDADLIVAGWRVVRVTDRRLTSEPLAVARQLRRLLA